MGNIVEITAKHAKTRKTAYLGHAMRKHGSLEKTWKRHSIPGSIVL